MKQAIRRSPACRATKCIDEFLPWNWKMGQASKRLRDPQSRGCW